MRTAKRGDREMNAVLPVRGFARLCVALVLLASPILAWSATLVQHIGDLSGKAAEAVVSTVTVMPFSPSIDPRTTPIILSPGKAFLKQGRGERTQVDGLTSAERKAIRQAYGAGQTILVLDASAHDVEALHVLLQDGAAHTSTTDPVVLAYALRQENNLPKARAVTKIRPSAPLGGDSDADGSGLAPGDRHRDRRADASTAAFGGRYTDVDRLGRQPYSIDHLHVDLPWRLQYPHRCLRAARMRRGYGLLPRRYWR
ncbi:MAG: hypothetical protein ABFS45_09065 [Pseudomonadota bacterium]